MGGLLIVIRAVRVAHFDGRVCCLMVVRVGLVDFGGAALFHADRFR